MHDTHNTKEVWTSRSVLRRSNTGLLSAARLTDGVGAIVCGMCGSGRGEEPAGPADDRTCCACAAAGHFTCG